MSTIHAFVSDSAPLRYDAGVPVRQENGCGARPAFPIDRTVVDCFCEHARLTPQSLAIDDAERRLSYSELDAASNRIAAVLIGLGLAPEEPVPVLMPPSSAYIAAILGVLKAGGCYLPIESDTPIRRVEFILTDSRSRIVLTDDAGRERVRGFDGTVLNINALMDQDAGADFARVSIDSRQRIYIAYTSGSTGSPKGVEIEHRSVANLVWNYIHQFQLTTQDRSSLLAYLGFDVSVADIWPILCAGGTLVIPPAGLRHDPDGLIGWLHARKITLTFVPTGLAELLFSRAWPAAMALRVFTTGGDRLRVRPPRGLPFTVVNGYGPTECTVFATWSVVAPQSAGLPAPPIGRALANMRAYVLDEELKPVPVGGAGELYLSGVQVGRGYLGRPELTAGVFLVDPFDAGMGARMYRTGDWARWMDDGELEFLGRRDLQIQVRGARVELGEIEAALFQHPSVLQACCVPLLDEDMPMGTAAHVVVTDPTADLTQLLRPFLLERLPELLVPLKFTAHERLPLTPQGKLDRAALMACAAKPATPTEVAAGGEWEAEFARIWNGLLPLAATGRADATFCELGGDSLLAMKLLLRIEEVTGRRLEYAQFHRRPTFAGMLDALRGRVSERSSSRVIPLRKSGSRPPLFCLHNSTGIVDIYTHLAAALGEDQPVYGIRPAAIGNVSQMPSSIEEAAAATVRQIRQIQPDGAPGLVGYSWAGLLGFEVARQLLAQDGLTCFCALIGTSAPNRKRSAAYCAGHFLSALPSWLWDVAFQPRGMKRRVSSWMMTARAAKRRLSRNAGRPRAADEDQLSTHYLNLGGGYHPGDGIAIPLTVFRERADYSPRRLPLSPAATDYLTDFGWSHWTRGEVDVQWVDGDHESILSYPDVAPLAEGIRRAFDRFRGARQS